MQSILVDTSIITSYLAPDEYDENAEKVFDDYYSGKTKLFILELTFYEVLNNLKILTKRKRINKKKASELMDLFLSYEFPIVSNNYRKTFEYSIETDLSFYDAAYLEASKSNNLELITCNYSPFPRNLFL